MFVKFLRWTSLLLMMEVVCSLPAAKASVYVTGQVVLASTQAPLSGATLSLFSGDHPTPVDVSQSLHNGSFVLQAPAAGEYRLEASGVECFTTTQTINVPKRGVSALHVSVRGRPTLLLQLVGQDVAPVPNHRMQVLLQTVSKAGKSRGYVSAETSPQGVAQVTVPEYFPEAGDVQSLSILVRVPGEGFGEAHLQQWPPKLLVIRVGRPGLLSGVVVDAAGKPLAGVGVIATRIVTPDTLMIGRGRMDVASDAAGLFTMGALAPGRYHIELANLDPKLYPPVEVDVGDKAVQVKFAPARK